nr:hypothetical protein [Tanacetum cinerariifolium]
ELVCCGVKWRRTWGVLWEWWSGVEWWEKCWQENRVGDEQ